MARNLITRGFRDLGWMWLSLLLPTATFWIAAGPVAAGEIIFLQDGRTIQAERSEIIGDDQIRVWKPAGVVVLPRSKVLSIHPTDPPTAFPSSPPPAAVYGNLTQRMTDEVHHEIQEQSETMRLK